MKALMLRGGLIVIVSAAAALGGATAAAAQEGGPRWQAWLGCWESSALASAPADAPEGGGMLCVVPTAEAEAVEVVSVAGGALGSRSLIRADGQQHAAEREGCTGWESASWSSGGTRLYLESEFDCAGGVERRSSGIMAFSPGGDWIDVQAVAAGANSGVQAVRYRAVGSEADIPADLAASITSRSLASEAARMAAAGRIGPDDVIEASAQVEALAVEAWLLERESAFTVDATTLTRLADAGVSTRVIDLLVAQSYPEMFAIDNGAGDQARRAPPPMWDPWGYPGWGGYYPYGARRGRWYGGYPAVIVVRQPDNGSGNGGKAVKGRGYTRGDSGGSAEPTSRPSSGGDAARSGGGGGGRSTGRTAKPKDD